LLVRERVPVLLPELGLHQSEPERKVRSHNQLRVRQPWRFCELVRVPLLGGDRGSTGSARSRDDDKCKLDTWSPSVQQSELRRSARSFGRVSAKALPASGEAGSARRDVSRGDASPCRIARSRTCLSLGVL
jgi:hypothetical protein